VLVRAGCIARIRDAVAAMGKEFLIDSAIFPGNSGGPVVTRPEIVSIEGTKPVNRSYLVGIVRAYLPYTDVAISVQTQKPRVTFEENSGLASVIPMDFVDAVVKQIMESTPQEDGVRKAQ